MKWLKWFCIVILSMLAYSFFINYEMGWYYIPVGIALSLAVLLLMFGRKKRPTTQPVAQPRAKSLSHQDSVILHTSKDEEMHKSLGVEKYKVLATLDKGTCSVCGDMDGKVFDLSESKAGVTAPPFCERCRCTAVPYFVGDEELVGERIARDPATGKNYYVDRHMVYNTWKETVGL